MAKEISDNDLIGAQTLANITQRAQDKGLGVRRDDVRFVLEVVSEADPWFEQGASANLFAGRFRNFVVARCRGQGLNLSADELDLIDAWFAGGTLPQPLLAAGNPAARHRLRHRRLPRWHRPLRQRRPQLQHPSALAAGGPTTTAVRSNLRSRRAPRPHRPSSRKARTSPASCARGCAASFPPFRPWRPACRRRARASRRDRAASGRGRATSRPSVQPRARRSAPAQATMAALSVHRAAGGTCSG